MKKIIFLLIVIIALNCSNKQTIKTIGFAQFASDPVTQLCFDGFVKALEDKGYINRVNIRIEKQNAQGDYNSISGITKYFEEKKVDLAVALSTVCLQDMIKQNVKYPIVFAAIANPFIVGAGKTDSNHLSNVTGVPSTAPIGETINLIKNIFPTKKRIGTLFNPAEPNSVFYAEFQKEAAKKLNFEIIQEPVLNIKDIEKGLDNLINQKVEIIYQISDIISAAGFSKISDRANKNKIPLFCNQIIQVNSGASLGLCLDFFKNGYEAGLQAVRILNGESPASIPFYRMDRIILTVNKTSAKNQNVIISDELLKKLKTIYQ